MQIFKKLFIIFIFISIYYAVMFQNILHISHLRLFFLLLSIMSLIIILFKYKPRIQKYQTYLLYYILFISIISLTFVWNNYFSINLFLSFFIALTIYSVDKHLFMKLLKITFFIQLGLQTYEYLTNVYIYENIVQIYGKEITTSVDYIGYMRAKGLFEGALTASSFSIYIAYLNRNNPIMLVAALYSSMLTNTRLSMLVIMILIIIYYINKMILNQKNINLKVLNSIFFVLLVIGSLMVIYFLIIPILFEGRALSRIYETFDTQSSTHMVRQYFWAMGIYEYFNNYEIHNFLFGNSLYFATKYGNSAESDWLMLLLETGLFGFLSYFVPMLYILFRNYKKKKWDVFLLIIMWFLIIFSYRHFSTAYTNVLHWILVFTYIDEINSKKVS